MTESTINEIRYMGDLRREVEFLRAALGVACSEGHLNAQSLNFVLGRTVRDQVDSGSLGSVEAEVIKASVFLSAVEKGQQR
jgi:hypothetical protein